VSEWWTYRLSDFLMFSPTTYWRLVERYNQALWPLQLALLAIGLVLLWRVAARRPMAQREVLLVLAVTWVWVGWAFHWQRYAPINWAAQYFAAAFALQGLLLLGAAAVSRRPDVRLADGGLPITGGRLRVAGLCLAVAGVLLYPLLALAQGRTLHQAEVFGLMPEPTALASLGLIMALHPRWSGGLAVIPVLSLLIGLATWWLLRG